MAPDLVVLDGFTRNRVEDIDIFYHLGDTSVTINQNTTGMYNVTPEIIPVNNSNGVGIASLSYTPASKTVRLYLDSTFSDQDAFPYNVGSKIFVENLNVGVGSTLPEDITLRTTVISTSLSRHPIPTLVVDHNMLITHSRSTSMIQMYQDRSICQSLQVE